MTYTYNSHIRLSTVKLYVADMIKMTDFYTTYIGFNILEQTETRVSLTADGKEALLVFEKTDLPAENNYGLYHTAILVPTRDHLGLALRHLLINQIPLTGAADHGYSEAIYLDDPEGNGIEIYRDKPMSQWDIREDGSIPGVTEEMDGQSMLDNLTNIPLSYSLPSATVIGHVHLSVKNAAVSSKLYQRVFDLADKFSVSSASWIASGDYHHQLAFNQWSGPNLNKREDKRPGLAYLAIEYANKNLYQIAIKKARLLGMSVIKTTEKYSLVQDSDGIRIKIMLAKE